MKHFIFETLLEMTIFWIRGRLCFRCVDALRKLNIVFLSHWDRNSRNHFCHAKVNIWCANQWIRLLFPHHILNTTSST